MINIICQKNNAVITINRNNLIDKLIQNKIGLNQFLQHFLALVLAPNVTSLFYS